MYLDKRTGTFSILTSRRGHVQLLKKKRLIVFRQWLEKIQFRRRFFWTCLKKATPMKQSRTSMLKCLFFTNEPKNLTKRTSKAGGAAQPSTLFLIWCLPILTSLVAALLTMVLFLVGLL